MRPLYGSHLSISGGVHLAIEDAVRLKMDAVQVFTKNQRQWSSQPLQSEQVALWHAAVRATQWVDPRQRIVSHNSYLVNLASPDDEQRSKSIALQRDELERCETLDIAWCVMHPGAHLGSPRRPSSPNILRGSPNADELAGLKRIASALDAIHADTLGVKVITCLETTTGSGTNLGYDFSHLAIIRDLVCDPQRVGICLDTCHIVAAGYDMSTSELAKGVLDEFDSICGLKNLRVVHINDSVGALGSRRDRHAHIGQGCCGDACFHAILNRSELRATPMILETPKEDPQNGRDWDLVNIDTLESIRLHDLSTTARRGFAMQSLVTIIVVGFVVYALLNSFGCRASRSVRPSSIQSQSSATLQQPTSAEKIKLASAENLRQQGNNESALAIFQEVLAQNPLLPEAYIGIGDVRFAQGRYGDAEPNYRRAARLDPADFQAQYGHGRTLQMLGRLAEAIGAYQRAIVANPKSAEANLNMATAYLSLGEARVAAQFAERAIALEPRNGAAHVNLGVAYERLGRPGEAIQQYQAAAELMPPTTQLMINMVNAYVADGRYPEAVNTAVALTKLSSVPETFERLGWAEFRAGNYDSSSIAYRQAVVLDPRYWPAWNGIGVNALNRWLLSEKRDSQAGDEARRAFRSSMQSNPNQPKVLKLYTTYGL
ncbi:MAG: deoxyribonuclease IV [Planctomycetota bacterium]|nr:deoxyribonuclease IV [Planctomycetota bacterium]MDA1262882.1 deoxyribonuclease IV [Planctomycetota bacterium]